MKNRLAVLFVALGLAVGSLTSFEARAQAGPSAISAVSGLSVAAVISGNASPGDVSAIPAMLSIGGAVLVVVAVQASAKGTVYVLERASDGARASIEVAGRGLASTAAAVGASVVVSVVASGVVLSAAGEALAFIPNALGRALLLNERLS